MAPSHHPCVPDVEKEWDGIAAARNRLASMFGSLMTDSEFVDKVGADGIVEVRHILHSGQSNQPCILHAHQDPINQAPGGCSMLTKPSGSLPQAPPGRLLELLEQAVEFQISSSRYQPRLLPPITSLLRDYECFVLPNALAHDYHGHASNVKCVDFLGQDGDCLVSGSSDQTLRMWCTGSPQCGSVKLEGHNSRVWDLHCSPTGPIVCRWEISRQAGTLGFGLGCFGCSELGGWWR